MASYKQIYIYRKPFRYLFVNFSEVGTETFLLTFLKQKQKSLYEATNVVRTVECFWKTQPRLSTAAIRSRWQNSACLFLNPIPVYSTSLLLLYLEKIEICEFSVAKIIFTSMRQILSTSPRLKSQSVTFCHHQPVSSNLDMETQAFEMGEILFRITLSGLRRPMKDRNPISYEYSYWGRLGRTCPL